MDLKLLLLAPFALLMSACTIPMNTAEFRQAAKANAALLTSESFEVNRPFSEVARTLKDKGPECLDFQLGSATRNMFGGSSNPVYYAQTKQAVVISKDKAVLTFQVKYKNTITKEPEDGSYFLVADAYRVSKNKTRVDVYRRTKVDLLLEALKGWSSGENLGCPDPAKYLD
jgi:hypothetical protein